MASHSIQLVFVISVALTQISYIQEAFGAGGPSIDQGFEGRIEEGIELLNPESFQKQAVDALRNLSRSPFQILRRRFDNGKEHFEIARFCHENCF